MFPGHYLVVLVSRERCILNERVGAARAEAAILGWCLCVEQDTKCLCC